MNGQNVTSYGGPFFNRQVTDARGPQEATLFPTSGSARALRENYRGVGEAGVTVAPDRSTRIERVGRPALVLASAAAAAPAATFAQRLEAVGGKVDSALGIVNRHPRWTPADGDDPRVPILHGTAIRELRSALADARTLQRELDSHAQIFALRDDDRLHEIRFRSVGMLLALCVPGLGPGVARGPGLARAAPPDPMAPLINDLLTLDDRFAATAAPGYALDRLLNTLPLAQIRMLLAKGGAENVALARDLLHAQVRALLDATAAGGDASPLLALVGRNNEIDGALHAAFKDAARAFMLEASAREAGVPVAALEPEVRAIVVAQADAHVAAVIAQNESAAAMRNAPGSPAGARPFAGSVAVDFRLVDALRASLGPRTSGAADLGIAAQRAAQQAVAHSAGADTMRGRLQGRIDELETAMRAHEGGDRYARAHANELRQQVASLRGQLAQLRTDRHVIWDGLGDEVRAARGASAREDAQAHLAATRLEALALRRAIGERRPTEDEAEELATLDDIDAQLTAHLTRGEPLELKLGWARPRPGAGQMPRAAEGGGTPQPAQRGQPAQTAQRAQPAQRAQRAPTAQRGQPAQTPQRAEAAEAEGAAGAGARSRLEQLFNLLDDLDELRTAQARMDSLAATPANARDAEWDRRDAAATRDLLAQQDGIVARHGESLLFGGLDEASLEQIGCSRMDARDVMTLVRQLAQLGLASTAEVRAAVQAINTGMHDVFASERAMAFADSAAPLIGAGRLEQEAARLGDRLLESVTGEPEHVADARADARGPDAAARRTALAQRMRDTAGYALTHAVDSLADVNFHADALAPSARARRGAVLDMSFSARGELFPVLHRQLRESHEFLRSPDRAVREAARAEVRSATDSIDTQVLAGRAAQLGPRVCTLLRRAVHCAILAQVADTPLHEFEPHRHAAAIKATLLEWGVPVESLAPEIEMQLMERFGTGELNGWHDDALSSPGYQAALRRAALQALPHKSTGTDPLAALKERNFTPGDRLRLTFAVRVDGQTGRIYLEPTGFAGLNIRGGGTASSSVEISRGANFWDLSFRLGAEARASLQLSVSVPMASFLGLNLGVTLQGDASRASAHGVTLRFHQGAGRDSDACRAALENLLGSLLSGEPVDAAALASASAQVLPLHESRVAGGVSLQARATGGADSPVAVAGAGISAGAIARAGASGTSQATTQLGTHGGVLRSETQRAVSLEAGVGMFQSAGFGVDRGEGAGMHSATADMNGARRAAVVHTKVKTRTYVGRDGLVKPGSDRMVQVARRTALRLENLGSVFGPEVGGLVAAMERTVNHRGLQAIQDLLDAVRGNQINNVQYTLDEGLRDRANALTIEANDILAGGAGPLNDETIAAAKNLLRIAQSWREHTDSYVPAKIQRIEVADIADARTATVGFVAASEERQAKSETIRQEVKFDAAAVQSVWRKPNPDDL